MILTKEQFDVYMRKFKDGRMTPEEDYLFRALAGEREVREALQRHFDEAGPEHNLLALLDHYHDREQAAKALVVKYANALEEISEVYDGPPDGAGMQAVARAALGENKNGQR